jgi:hypothetical protein
MENFMMDHFYYYNVLEIPMLNSKMHKLMERMKMIVCMRVMKKRRHGINKMMMMKMNVNLDFCKMANVKLIFLSCGN